MNDLENLLSTSLLIVNKGKVRSALKCFCRFKPREKKQAEWDLKKGWDNWTEKERDREKETVKEEERER